jgi:tRNA (guanine6-N2)-methyltransferase
VGVRLGERPLHRRSYKRVHVPGSLKPPVAAALLSLVEIAPGLRVLDPCCGAGTTLIEAAMYGALAQGGDSDPEAVAAARANAYAAGLAVEVRRWDARALPILDASVDRIVSNLPWGRQAGVDASLSSFYRRVCAQMCRALAPGGQIALLTDTPGLISFDGLECSRCIEISLFGQTPTITIWKRSE